MGLWIWLRLTPIFYPTIYLFGPLDTFWDWVVSDERPRFIFMSLFKTAPYLNRSISSRFTRVHQYPCCCDFLTLRSMPALRFALLVAPATETTFFRSDDCLIIASPWRVILRYLIKDLYGASYCTPVPMSRFGTGWYRISILANSVKLIDAFNN
jgi:hypothetical protein